MGDKSFDFLFQNSNSSFSPKMQAMNSQFNAERVASGLKPLMPSSGLRDADKNANEMMKNVRAAGSLEQAHRNGYTRKEYQPALKAYYKNPIAKNLKAIGDIRREREKLGQVTGGHRSGDSMDYSLRGISDRREAMNIVSWFKSHGLRPVLENWADNKPKGNNAHIHIDGVLGWSSSSRDRAMSDDERVGAAKDKLSMKLGDKKFLDTYTSKDSPGHADSVSAMESLYRDAYPSRRRERR